jgi:predicted small metal-binding protein
MPERSIALQFGKETTMAKVLKCSDLMPGCSFEARGNSEDEVLKVAAEHAKTAHNLTEITPELQSKVRSAIHDEERGQTAGSSN